MLNLQQGACVFVSHCWLLSIEVRPCLHADQSWRLTTDECTRWSWFKIFSSLFWHIFTGPSTSPRRIHRPLVQKISPDFWVKVNRHFNTSLIVYEMMINRISGNIVFNVVMYIKRIVLLSIATIWLHEIQSKRHQNSTVVPSYWVYCGGYFSVKYSWEMFLLFWPSVLRKCSKNLGIKTIINGYIKTLSLPMIYTVLV